MMVYNSWDEFYRDNPSERPDPEDFVEHETIYLCHNCGRFDGDYCEKYGKMPLYFFGRKIWCKYMKKVDWDKIYKQLEDDVRRGIY